MKVFEIKYPTLYQNYDYASCKGLSKNDVHSFDQKGGRQIVGNLDFYFLLASLEFRGDPANIKSAKIHGTLHFICDGLTNSLRSDLFH